MNYLIDPCRTENACAQDVMKCPDGSFVPRNPKNNCNFSPCPGQVGKVCSVCVGGTDTGNKDENGCPIYNNCPHTCPEDCKCDGNGNIIVCRTTVSCPSKCKCDNNGNILDCDKSECIDSDGGKNYYTKGKVFVPHSDSTYLDVCAYDHQGNQNNDRNLLFEAYCFTDKFGYGYDTYSCPNGCKDGACNPFYEKKEELSTKTEKESSSAECPAEKCKEISNNCLGKDKIIIEE